MARDEVLNFPGRKWMMRKPRNSPSKSLRVIAGFATAAVRDEASDLDIVAAIDESSTSGTIIMLSRRNLILTAFWIIAFIIALLLDDRIAYWVHTSGLGKAVEGKWWAQIIKVPGDFGFTIAVAALLAIFKQIQPRQAVFVVLASVVSGTNALVKWMVGRFRPYKFPGSDGLFPFHFHPLFHGLPGLFNQHDLCFPSGHECTAGALATAMVLVWPRGAWIFIVLAILVGIERPAENAHYASDVIGAMGFAIVLTVLLHKALAGWLQPTQKWVDA
jgi:membrane-associated phospholipid phosphatase